MKVELDEKELKVLLYGMNMYQKHIMDQNIEIAKLEEIEELKESRKKEQQKQCQEQNHHFCCCFENGGERKKDRRPYSFSRDEAYLKGLKDKLRKAEMQLPSEEHSGPFTYGENFGYEKAIWLQTGHVDQKV